MTPVRGTFVIKDFAHARAWLTQPMGGWRWEALSEEERVDRFYDEDDGNGSVFVLLDNGQIVRVRAKQ